MLILCVLMSVVLVSVMECTCLGHSKTPPLLLFPPATILIDQVTLDLLEKLLASCWVPIIMCILLFAAGMLGLKQIVVSSWSQLLSAMVIFLT